VRKIAAAAALATLVGAGAAGASPLRYPATVTQATGGMRVSTQADPDALLTGVQIFVEAGLERQTAATNGAAALTAECVARTPVAVAGASQPLRDAIASLGGSLDYTIEDDNVHYYIEARPDRMPQVLALFGTALAHPDFSAATLPAARAEIVRHAGDGEHNPLHVGVQMFKESFLEQGSAYPEYGTAGSVSQMQPEAVRSFHDRTYRRGAVWASVAGRSTPAIDAALGSVARDLPDGTLPALDVKARPIPATAPRIVAQRDIARPFVVLGFAAPAPGSKDFGAMLILQSMMQTAFQASSATTVLPNDRAIGTFYMFDSVPSSLVVYVNGGTGVDPSLALRAIILLSKAMSDKPLGADSLRRFQTQAEGAFVTDTTTLADRSYVVGSLAAGALADRSINGAVEAIESATGADVQRVAKTYLQRYIVAFVLPRAGSAQSD